ncbi:MAG: DUF983 domain-containing protein [Acidobacteria bacterium]|nr:DUF983 domain-containing protein [Acidobacteriota bacterium]MCA1621233.1 DUF983 domain-containing protein [Acidobacteriota bacterium]
MSQRKDRSIIKALSRGARLRCPVCGGASVFQTPFRVRPECPACGAVFQREEGFFVGAIMINVVTTEAAVLATAGLWLLSSAGGGAALLPILFAVALLFPVAFYHHAWSLWLAGDHLVEGLPRRRPGA